MKGKVINMKKIKKFLQDNKEEMKVLAYGASMMIAGIYIGRKYEGLKINNALDNLARTGKTVTNFVDGKLFELSVTEKK